MVRYRESQVYGQTTIVLVECKFSWENLRNFTLKKYFYKLPHVIFVLQCLQYYIGKKPEKVNDTSLIMKIYVSVIK